MTILLHLLSHHRNKAVWLFIYWVYSHSEESGSSALSSDSFPSSIPSSSLSGWLAGSSGGIGHVSCCRAFEDEPGPPPCAAFPRLEGFLDDFAVDLGWAPDPLPFLRPAGIFTEILNERLIWAYETVSQLQVLFPAKLLSMRTMIPCVPLVLTFDLHMLNIYTGNEWWICQAMQCVLLGSLPSCWLNCVEKDHQKLAR